MKDKNRKGNKAMGMKLLSLAAVTIIIGGCSAKNGTVKQPEDAGKEHNIKITDINYDDFISETALHDAVRAKDLELVKYLLSQNINLDIKDIYGYTPLHIAVRLDQLDIARELIAKGAKVNTMDNYKDTPLLDATRNNFTKLSQLLICNGAYRNVTDINDMSSLHNSAKNSNLFISKMLRADDLLPYCSALGVKINDLELSKEQKVCGVYENGIEPVSKLSLIKDINETVGEYEVEGKWCSTLPDMLENGEYILSIESKDDINRTAQDKVLLSVNDDIRILSKDGFGISLDDVDEVETNNPKICGEVKNGTAKTVEVTLAEEENGKRYGVYNAAINGNSWCADVVDNLPNGNYTIKAKGMNIDKLVSVALDDKFRVKAQETGTLTGLYEALNEEFKNDFTPWEAELTSDLFFRFKNPDMIFSHGKNTLNSKFKTILDDFIPRYLKVLEMYKDEIAQIRVEGHTSSVYKNAKNEQQRYSFNKKLSQSRANSVKSYALKGISDDPSIDKQWLESVFKAYGMAYDNLILDENGQEDQKASRRVEFKIQTR